MNSRSTTYHKIQCPVNARAFTLVEAIIVVVVIAALLAFFIPYMREQERQRLQVLANSEPWEVFEFHAAPAKESFAEDEDIILKCVMVNLTDYPLTTPTDSHSFILIFEGTDYFTDGLPATSSDELADLSSVIPEMAIGPGESARFNVRFRYGIGTGSAEVRVAYWNENARRYIAREFSVRDGDVIHGFQIISGILQSDEMRFQSDSFRLVVEANDSSETPTFDELIAIIKQNE